jgi:GTP cyclohydrolase I
MEAAAKDFLRILLPLSERIRPPRRVSATGSRGIAMSPQDASLRPLPDVTEQPHAHAAGALDWVGMDGIDMPVCIGATDGRSVQTGAKVGAWVNLLRPEARGIHMSRLYLHLDRHLADEPLTPCGLRHLLRDFLESHADLADAAMVRARFDLRLRRPALQSDHSGWKAYPVEVTARMHEGRFTVELSVSVEYSSTCPCSAALARQLIQQRFEADFPLDVALERSAVLAWLGSEQGICATPHSQRSTAKVLVRLANGFDLPIVDLVDTIEDALKTPVQTAVKREDEQAFALLNGQNLMFCEDAARRMHGVLDGDPRIQDFRVLAVHHESLHAHDAVAVATKGVDGGYRDGNP